MALEGDAEKVVDLTLLPIGCLPNAFDARHDGIVARQVDLEDDPMTVTERKEMIDDLDRSPCLVIDPRLVGEALEGEVGLIVKKAAYFEDRGRRNQDRGVL